MSITYSRFVTAFARTVEHANNFCPVTEAHMLASIDEAKIELKLSKHQTGKILMSTDNVRFYLKVGEQRFFLENLEEIEKFPPFQSQEAFFECFNKPPG